MFSDRCFPPITVISCPQEPWTPSCSFTAWNKTKLCSFFFFYHVQANSCCIFAKHLLQRGFSPSDMCEWQSGCRSWTMPLSVEGKGGRGFRETLTLKQAWGTYLGASVHRACEAAMLPSPSRTWKQTGSKYPGLIPWTELTRGQSTHLEPQLEGVPGFSSGTWSQQPSQPATSTSETLGLSLGWWWGRRLSRLSLPCPPETTQVCWQLWSPFMAVSLGPIYFLKRGPLTPPKYCSTRSKLIVWKTIGWSQTEGEYTRGFHALSCEGTFPLLCEVEWTIPKGLTFLMGFRMSKYDNFTKLLLIYYWVQTKTRQWMEIPPTGGDTNSSEVQAAYVQCGHVSGRNVIRE